MNNRPEPGICIHGERVYTHLGPIGWKHVVNVLIKLPFLVPILSISYLYKYTHAHGNDTTEPNPM